MKDIEQIIKDLIDNDENNEYKLFNENSLKLVETVKLCKELEQRFPNFIIILEQNEQDVTNDYKNWSNNNYILGTARDIIKNLETKSHYYYNNFYKNLYDE